VWFGADPGGKLTFGVAILHDDGTFNTRVVSSADEALAWFKGVPRGIGIDAPLWWSSGRSSDRHADRFIRTTYRIASGTVQTANSLKGAVLVQGLMLAQRMRERFPFVPITEAHPKALLKAQGLGTWEAAAAVYGLSGLPASEHERDALLGAVAAREGVNGSWPNDLAATRLPSEQDPAALPHGPVHYYWPS
jgi:predicted nuclease with RNAse H fold